MAMNPLQPGAGPANTAAREDAASIHKIAIDIQMHGYQLQAVNWAIDECLNVSAENPEREDAWDRAMSLMVVAGGLLKAMMDRAREIEAMTSGVRQEAQHG